MIGQGCDLARINLKTLLSLLDAKKYKNSLSVISPRKNRNFHSIFKSEMAIRRRRHGQDRHLLNPPNTFLEHGRDKVQNYHRTLSLAFLLEDKLQRSNCQYKVVPEKFHKLLALRNFMSCQIEVIENVEFGTLSDDNRSYFGLINGIKMILDSIFPSLPY